MYGGARGRLLGLALALAVLGLWSAAVVRGAEPPVPASDTDQAAPSLVEAAPVSAPGPAPLGLPDAAPSLAPDPSLGTSPPPDVAGPSPVATLLGSAVEIPSPPSRSSVGISPMPSSPASGLVAPTEPQRVGPTESDTGVARESGRASPPPGARHEKRSGHGASASSAARGGRVRTASRRESRVPRRALIRKTCGARPHSTACSRVLAPHSCDPKNPFLKAPFSCRYLLRLNPCSADTQSSGCSVFLDNPCLSRPHGLACTLLRAGSTDKFCHVVRDVPCFQERIGDISDCHLIEQDGTAPRSAPCRLFAAIFLDTCEQAPELCGNPYGGTQEALAFTGPLGDTPAPGSSPGGTGPRSGAGGPGRRSTLGLAVLHQSLPRVTASSGGGASAISAHAATLPSTGFDLVSPSLSALAILLLGAALRTMTSRDRPRRWSGNRAAG